MSTELIAKSNTFRFCSSTSLASAISNRYILTDFQHQCLWGPDLFPPNRRPHFPQKEFSSSLAVTFTITFEAPIEDRVAFHSAWASGIRVVASPQAQVASRVAVLDSSSEDDYEHENVPANVAVRQTPLFTPLASIFDDAGVGANNRFWGAAGRDLLIGAGGRDLFFGGDGNDRIRGGWDNDRLDGQWGVNRNDGGRGRDRCIAPDHRHGAIECEARFEASEQIIGSTVRLGLG